MGRRIRDLGQSEWQHIFNRGADRQDIFSCDADRACFETWMEETFREHRVELHAYALMNNHIHLLLRNDDGAISDAMQRLCARYASAYNGRTAREGPVFTGRFKNVAVTTDGQLHQVARYIHRNPLAFVPTRALPAYRWSSLGALVGRRPLPTGLTIGPVTGGVVSLAYLDWVLEPQPSDLLPLGGLPPLIPTSPEAVECAVDRAVSSSAVPPPQDWRPDELRRTLAAQVAIETRAATPAELAARLGFRDQGSVRRLARKGRVCTSDSAWFAAVHDAVLADLRAAA